MKNRDNRAIRRAWLEIGALTDEQVLEAASAVIRKEKTKRAKKPRKGKAKK